MLGIVRIVGLCVLCGMIFIRPSCVMSLGLFGREL